MLSTLALPPWWGFPPEEISREPVSLRRLEEHQKGPQARLGVQLCNPFLWSFTCIGREYSLILEQRKAINRQREESWPLFTPGRSHRRHLKFVTSSGYSLELRWSRRVWRRKVTSIFRAAFLYSNSVLFCSVTILVVTQMLKTNKYKDYAQVQAVWDSLAVHSWGRCNHSLCGCPAHSAACPLENLSCWFLFSCSTCCWMISKWLVV